MINKFTLAKALRDNAQTIATANSYTLVTKGEGKEPGPNETFILESVIFGPDNAIGIADNSSDQQTGIYQLSVRTPKHKTKWNNLIIVGILQEGFPRGLDLSAARIKNSQVSSQMQNDTHLIYVLSVTFSAIG